MILRACVFIFYATVAKAYYFNYEECLNYTVYPVQYELIITPHIYKNMVPYYKCDLVIKILANAPGVQTIELDAEDMVFDYDSIQVIDTNRRYDLVNKYRPFEYSRDLKKLFIYLNRPLIKYDYRDKTLYDVKISFTKYVKEDTKGIFIVNYDDAGHQKKQMLVTRLSAHNAKYFIPCFDNLQFESVFKFIVKLANGNDDFKTTLVISDEQKREMNDKKAMIISYVPSKMVSLHQVGFHVSNHESISVTSRYTNDTLIVWTERDKLQQHKYILDFGRNIIDIIHEYCHSKRPIVNGVINIVSVPKLLDGYEIESWNLLTNGENHLAFNKQHMSIKQKQEMEFELVQQLNRIWLGNPGEEQKTKWKEQWFKEGIATYLAYYFLAQYYKIPFDSYMVHIKHKAMSLDWHHETPSLGTFNKTLAVEIPTRYKNVVAWKTASILWMLENWVGSDKFHKAFINYINSRRGQTVSLDEFIIQLDLDTVECQNQFLNGMTSLNVLNSWFKYSGYPVVNVEVLRDRALNAILLKQNYFSITHAPAPSSFLIPVSYSAQHRGNCYNCYQPAFTITAQTYSFEENLDGGWIILNRNATGYYRVNYDADNWKLIAKTLQENHNSIDILNRAQIVNDVFALYAAGEIPLELSFDILSYLDKERSEIVWLAAIEGFELLKTEGTRCKMTKLMFEEWKGFMRNRIGPVFDSLVESNDQRMRHFKSIVTDFACSLSYQPCIFRLDKIYTGYLKGTNVLFPDLREACYYMSLVNQTYDDRQALNIYELEDKSVAEHKWNFYRRFYHRIPQGSLSLPIMQSTTTSSPLTSLPTAPVSSSPSQLMLSLVLITSNLFLTILN